MKNLEMINQCQDQIMIFLHNNTGLSYMDLRTYFEDREGNYRRLLESKMGPYDISVDVDLDEDFVRYSAILPEDENSRIFVDVSYDSDDELLHDLKTRDYMSWMDSAMMHLKEAVCHE